MGVFELFSKRQKKLRGDVADVFVYDSVPETLRVQIVHIWQDALGNPEHYSDPYCPTEEAYKAIVEMLCREYGCFQLPGTMNRGHGGNYIQELVTFLMKERNHERVLDAVELSFTAIDRLVRDWHQMHKGRASTVADEAIKELNARFREHGVGYRYEEGELIRIDSELVHSEVVQPALVLLRGRGYEGAQAEFLKAHEHYRHGRMKEALAESLKSLESVMKSICKKRRWSHPENATSKVLIQTIFDNGLVPAFWSQHFSSMRSMLESGVPTARNRLGGHGQGVEVVEVPQYLASYVLHQTAAAIVFLAEADKALP